jgi:WD40 repeat protein
VALTADGKRAVSGSQDHTLQVWDPEGNQPPRVLEGHTDGVWAVALTADGKRAISGSSDHTLRVWDLEGNQPPHVLEGHTDAVMGVALTADGKRANPALTTIGSESGIWSVAVA